MRNVPSPVDSAHDNPTEDARIRSVEIGHPEIHTVNVYERSDGSRYAVPFVHRDTYDDGTLWLDEPDSFEPDDKYRKAVEAAGVDICAVELDRDIPTFSASEVDAA